MAKGLNPGQKALIKKHGKITMKKSLVKIKRNEKKNSTKFFLCDCKSEILLIEYDYDANLADVAIYTNYSSGSLSFYQRLKYIYRILFYGKPYADQTLLNKKQIKELLKFLQSL